MGVDKPDFRNMTQYFTKVWMNTTANVTMNAFRAIDKRQLPMGGIVSQRRLGDVMRQEWKE